MRPLASLAMVAMLLVGTSAHPDERVAADCQEVLDRLAWLEQSTGRSLSDLERVRREAQGLSEWFGPEGFEAYIAAMRQQERTLRAQLDELRQTNCGGRRPG